jgi:hypothetical protein
MALRNVILKILFFTIFLFNFNAASAQYYFDSTYIKKYYNNAVWSLYQNYNNHSLYISQSFNKDTTVNSLLNPIAESLTDVGFIYSNEKRFFVINLYSVPNQPSKRKPQPKAINFIIGINDNNKLSVMLPESWTMSLVKEIQLNLLNHDKKNAKKIQPGVQGQGGFRSCKKSKNACRIEPAF